LTRAVSMRYRSTMFTVEANYFPCLKAAACGQCLCCAY
jgi:hypothetical protein